MEHAVTPRDSLFDFLPEAGSEESSAQAGVGAELAGEAEAGEVGEDVFAREVEGGGDLVDGLAGEQALADLLALWDVGRVFLAGGSAIAAFAFGRAAYVAVGERDAVFLQQLAQASYAVIAVDLCGVEKDRSLRQAQGLRDPLDRQALEHELLDLLAPFRGLAIGLGIVGSFALQGEPLGTLNLVAVEQSAGEISDDLVPAGGAGERDVVDAVAFCARERSWG